MKKRIFSMFLALVTLLCAVPFAAQAEEVAAPIAEEETATELADYYVKDGLVALFTAFDGSYISGSTWTDRVNGKKATLSSVANKKWTLREGGGVGFNTYYGMIDQYGVFTETSSYNNSGVNAVRVDFGLSLFPQEDMTVEYLAEYLPVYVTDINGNIALDEYKQPIETFDAMGNGPSGYASWPIDALGWFSCYSTRIDGYDSVNFGGNAASRGALHWVFDNTYWNSGHSSWWVGTGARYTGNGGMAILGDAFQQNGSIRTYEYSIDETLTVAEDGTRTVTALFSLRRDLVLYKDNSGNINSTANEAGGNTYYDKEVTDKKFHLSSDRPTDFYSIRIYDRTLNDEERLQNRVADIIHYYGLTNITEETLPALTAVVKNGNFGFEKDAAARGATKLQILSALKDEVIAHALYAQKGLQALYTAFDDTYVDLAAGTWTDRVNGKVATLGNKQYWALGADRRGVGSLMLWGSYINSTFSPTATTNNADIYGTHLDFGIAQLPAVDWTVEYVAEYKNIMAVDANGTPVKAIIEIADATWPANTSSLNDRVNGPVEQFGNLFGLTLKRDHYFTGSGVANYGGMGNVVYQYTTARRANIWTIEAAVPSNQNVLRKDGTSNVFQERGAIHTFEMARDSENDTNNTLYQYKDLTLYQSKTTTNVSCADEHVGGDDYFYLGERISVDYYAVRIYDRVLNDEERKGNRLADLIFYYDLNASDINTLKTLAKSLDFASYGFETEASAYAATQTALQQVIDRQGTEVGLYAQDGLLALWTAFGTADTVNTSAGTWTDRITGRTATLTTASRWTKGALGGVGFSVLHGTLDANGSYTATSAYNNVQEGGPRLDLGTSLLPEEDFTVEYLAMYTPVYVADANGNIAKDAQGNPIETYVAAGSNGTTTSYTNSHHKWPVDALGWFSAFTTNIDGYEASWGNGGRGTIYFIFNNQYWSSGNLSQFVGPGGNYGASSGMNVAGNPFHKNGAIRTYEYSVDETLTVAEDGARTVTALFALRRDLALYKDNSDRINSTANTSGGAAYFDKEIADGSYMFHLSCSRPTDFYSVRVYDRVLTDAERQQNRFADLINYYGILLPDGFINDDAQLAYLKEQVASVGFELDASRYGTIKTSLQAAIKNIYTHVTVIIGDKETETTVLGDKWLSPASLDGKILFGWKLMGENDTYTTFDAGASIPVKEGDVIRAFTLTKPQAMNSSSVKMMGDNSLGMRFTATLSKTEYLDLLNAFGKDNVSLGMIITPRAYVERAGIFTKEGLKAWAQGLGSSETPYVDIPLGGVWKMDGDTLTLAASLCNFSSVTLEKNISFAATAYVNIDKDGNGVIDQTVYGDFSAAACRTAKEVMEHVSYMYRDTLSDSETEWLDAFLEYYENRTYGEEGDKTVAEQRQEILTAMQIAKSLQVNYTVHPFAEGEVDAKYAHIQAISFDGLTLDGKKTRVFAYLGLPEGASADDPVPAVVLIHGGGGHAFLDWVYRWNQRGYAAIAMETTGCFPVTPGANVTEGSYSNAPHAFPDYILEVLGDDVDSYTLAPTNNSTLEYAEVDTMWQYHAISQVILSHNVLRQHEAVDNSRIGVEGVSWGGVLTSHVIGYDNRFAFAIPAYGSAYLGEEEKAFSSYANAYVDDLWAPERNLSNATMPVMWFDWADDTWFIMNSYTKSYLQQVQNNKNSVMVVLKDWGHSHVQVFAKEHGYAFADSICFGATSYVTFETQPAGQNVSCKLNVPSGVSGVGVRIHYLTEPIAYDKPGCPASLVEDFKTNSTALSFDSATGMITGTIPADVKYYYISVSFTTAEGKNLEVSSTFVQVK